MTRFVLKKIKQLVLTSTIVLGTLFARLTASGAEGLAINRRQKRLKMTDEV